MNNVVDVLQQQGMDTTSLTSLRDDIYYLTVPGSEALSCWHALRASARQTNFWPVIVGGDELDVELVLEELEYESDESPQEIVQAGLAIDPISWLRARVERDPDYYRDPRGTWPEDIQGSHSYTIPFDIVAQEPLSEVYLALLPTAVGWQIPAFLRYGGWNDCPHADAHVCMFKRWNDLYGAEVVGMSHDVVEMQVARPPLERSTALDLAWEQYVYCADIVSQGTQTLEALAATLLGASVWFFWWD